MDNLIGDYSYITDCGIPSFSFETQIICPSCSECCNSVDKCKINFVPIISVWVFSYAIFPFTGSVFLALLIYILVRLERKRLISLPFMNRSAISLYSEDSVYCLIFTKNRLALVIYYAVAIIQGWLFSYFLQKDPSIASDWEYNLSCPENLLYCATNKNTTWLAWTPFLIVSITFLGPDFVDAFFSTTKGN